MFEFDSNMEVIVPKHMFHSTIIMGGCYRVRYYIVMISYYDLISDWFNSHNILYDNLLCELSLTSSYVMINVT
jgi:hypothetical protein